MGHVDTFIERVEAEAESSPHFHGCSMACGVTQRLRRSGRVLNWIGIEAASMNFLGEASGGQVTSEPARTSTGLPAAITETNFERQLYGDLSGWMKDRNGSNCAVAHRQLWGVFYLSRRAANDL